VITKDASGKVHQNKDETATRHGAWRGVAAGAAVGLLFPPSVLGAAQAKHPSASRRGLFGRRDAEQQQDPAGRALAARQAEQAAKAEVEARAAQQHHEAWLEDHSELGHDYRDVSRELALRSRQRATFAELEQPAYLTDALGPVPESGRGRLAGPPQIG
jgi:hypothetical protein